MAGLRKASAANQAAQEANELAREANDLARRSLEQQRSFRWTLRVKPQPPSLPTNSTSPFSRPVIWLLDAVGAYRATDIRIHFAFDPNALRVSETRWHTFQPSDPAIEVDSGLKELEAFDIEGTSARITWVDPEGVPCSQDVPSVPIQVENA